MNVSVIIPTLNEEAALAATLDAVSTLRDVEIIVADGGSRDRTVEIARGRGAFVVQAPKGRGAQMHAGACAARGDVLWFLHADTQPPSDAPERMHEILGACDVVGGHFQVTFDGRSAAARFLTRLYNFLHHFGLRYGDSAYFVRRDVYQRVGGFRPLPIFEDLDLLRRLRRQGRFVRVPSRVLTSSRRFEGRSFARTFAWWVILQVLYWLRVSPESLGRLYPAIRSAGAKVLEATHTAPRR